MKIARRFTQAGKDVFAGIAFEKRTSRISHTDGSVVFEMKDAEIPASWTQLATDIMVSKYFRKAGVPQVDAEGRPVVDENGKVRTGPEKSVKQVVNRLAGCWRHWGEKYGYFDTAEDGQAFYDELAHMLLSQMAAPNSPQWFNTGLSYAYGMTGPAQGHWHVNPQTGQLEQTSDTYTHPQPHACFIQSITDDLVNDGGIMDLWVREARLFKYGSGTGTNFSKLRGENEALSGGGKSSGLMSFLKIGDRAAGAIKSGGTTRRAAKMCCLDLDHPDVEDFINWKVREEIKVAALVEGIKHLPKDLQEQAKKNKLKLDYDFNGEAYMTVSGQNSNNSVRVPNAFLKAVEEDGPWNLIRRTDGKIHKTIKARELWDQVGYAAWRCADPGVQYDDTINEWHTCPQSGRINASNPCVTGDTLVATASGFKRIASLVGGTEEIVNGNGDIAFVNQIFRTARNKEVFELRTQSGYRLRLTADHRVKTLNRGDVMASELRAGDKLELRGAGFGEEWLDDSVAEALGRALAMGGFDDLPDELTPGVSSEVSRLRSEFAEGEYESLRFTDRVFALCESSQAALLRGVFGGANDKWLNSVEFANQLQLLLLSFNVKTRIHAGDGPIHLGAGQRPFGTCFVSLEAAGRPKFRSVIGVSHRRTSLHLQDPMELQEQSVTDEFGSLVPAGVEDVYDLTEPQSDHFVANGIVVHNCSEYMFLDNTACNLASINLMKFFDAEAQTFDIEGFKHACRLWTIVLEVSVLMAAYPSKEIARLSYEYRTLGLGYANVGTMLMVAGIPYDSDGGRAICGAISAMMTGEAYATSSEMARELGPFPGFRKNRKDMLRVMKNHRAAAHSDAAAYDGLVVKPEGIDAALLGDAKGLQTAGLLSAARETWDRAVSLGEQFGYRNAQTTCIAPTGTIGLLMDCDTTGVEPDFALVKFKKLAGGGYFKIANQSIEPALRNLGYDEAQIKDILTYVLGTLSFQSPKGQGAICPINQEVLRAKGFTDEELAKMEACLPSVFELAFAFSPWSLGETTMQRLAAQHGFTQAQWQDPKFNLLKALGFGKKQIREANDVICGSQTIEGAPHLRDEHLAVFDCANRCGRKGKRFIHHMGHIKMMAAAQPFISGAISKTINLPNEVGIGDIEEAYRESWRLGLKAVALYRDGSKLSQPLNTSSEDEAGEELEAETIKAEASAAATADAQAVISSALGAPAVAHSVERIVERIVERPLRRRLPDTRHSITHKFDIQGHEGYLTVGLFEDSTPGEIFITMAKQGSTIGGLMDTVATLISLNLQYGVPVEAIVRKFEHMRFEPSGFTMNPDIPMAKSMMDYLARWLGMEFVPGYREANAPKRDMNAIEPPTPSLFNEPLEHVYKPSQDVIAQEAQPNTDAAENADSTGHGSPTSGASEKVPAIATYPQAAVALAGGRAAKPGNGNGHGNGHAGGGLKVSTGVATADAVSRRMAADVRYDALSQQTARMMGDAPICTCGAITVRNGSCYKCLNCGNSLGCS